MPSGNIIKEYLVGLGFKDDFTGRFKQVLSRSSQSAKTFAKGLTVAGTAVGTLLAAAVTGVAKLAANLVKGEDELLKFAKRIGRGRDEAFKIKAAMDAMGKSLDEIARDPKLAQMFKELQKDAAQIQLPDMSEGLSQVRGIQLEFVRMKQLGSYAIQWIGHYLLKYLQQPIQRVREIFSGLNDGFMKNMPKWADTIAKVLAGVVRLGTTVLRGAAGIFNAVKRIFDMIPKELKGVGIALGILAAFIKTVPIGKLSMIIGAALLLLENFFTYLDGGTSLIGIR